MFILGQIADGKARELAGFRTKLNGLLAKSAFFVDTCATDPQTISLLLGPFVVDQVESLGRFGNEVLGFLGYEAVQMLASLSFQSEVLI